MANHNHVALVIHARFASSLEVAFPRECSVPEKVMNMALYHGPQTISPFSP
jgi:hypothetical protein